MLEIDLERRSRPDDHRVGSELSHQAGRVLGPRALEHLELSPLHERTDAVQRFDTPERAVVEPHLMERAVHGERQVPCLASGRSRVGRRIGEERLERPAMPHRRADQSAGGDEEGHAPTERHRDARRADEPPG